MQALRSAVPMAKGQHLLSSSCPKHSWPRRIPGSKTMLLLRMACNLCDVSSRKLATADITEAYPGHRAVLIGLVVRGGNGRWIATYINYGQASTEGYHPVGLLCQGWPRGLITDYIPLIGTEPHNGAVFCPRCPWLANKRSVIGAVQ